MSSTVYEFRRGETIRLAIDVMGGSVGDVLAVTAQLRRRKDANQPVSASDPLAATFTVLPRAAAGDVPAGWDLTVPPSITAALEQGFYSGDARLQLGADDAEITESWTIRIIDAVTR